MKAPIRRSLGIVDQVRVALEPTYRLATCIGALLGAVVPVSTFAVLHGEVGDLAELDPRWLVVIGGLLYSAITVFRWGRLAFGSAVKAVGFTVLLEGVMTLSDQPWLSGLALGYLCLINAIATGVTLARGATVVAEQAAAPEAIAPAPPAAKPKPKRPSKERRLRVVPADPGEATPTSEIAP
jgi:hypothetical protein